MTAPWHDQWRDPATQVRVEVREWLCRVPVTGQYIERPRSLRMVWNYVQRIGPTAVWRKVRSRTAERARNQKMAGIGLGVVCEAPADSAVRPGQRVVFFAPNHSDRWPRLVLDAGCVCASEHAPDGQSRAAGVCTLSPSLQALAGWSPYSGVPLPGEVGLELRTLARAVASAPTGAAVVGGPVRERTDATGGPGGRPTAVVFGLGNFAKTQIVPPVRQHLHLAAIHEVDPDQLGAATGWGCTLDTAPVPRPGAQYDAWFIAGFHHTHADLAVRALRDGAYAVVEKPLVTTAAQLRALSAGVTAHPGRLFACFQRRYSRLHDWAMQDLGLSPGDPVDMHSLVYEIPLPPRHWYEWPNSGGRLISNGCHWLDYFLFTNQDSPVVDAGARRLRGHDVLAWARLENGAQMSLSLTDAGSARLGVRDVVDLRAGGTTVRMVDSTRYEAETTARVLRRRRVNPMHAYARMYDTICRAIAAGTVADDAQTLRSSALMLEMEADLE